MNKNNAVAIICAILFVLVGNMSLLSSHELQLAVSDKDFLVSKALEYAKLKKKDIDMTAYEVEVISQKDGVLVLFKPVQKPEVGIILGGVYSVLFKQINGNYEIIDFRLHP